MYRLHLQVYSKSYFSGVGVLTKRLHALILEGIQQVNPSLSQQLHDGKERQAFSTYFMPNEIIISSILLEVIQSLQQRFLLNDQIDLGRWKGIVQEMHLYHFTQEDIIHQFSDKLTLQFLTPTTFYQQGNYYPLPELTRLFVSANKLMVTIENLDIPRSELEQSVRKIRIEYASIATERVDFGKFSVIGFTGNLALNLKALPPTEQALFWKLAVYGSLMGFGYKTAWGLGQARIKPFSYPANEGIR
jgi:CRISPR-associated endoribonuclease Cas6